MEKILISDYDDTLFTDEITLKSNISQIKKFRENGNLFIIATSRSLNSIMKEIEKYNIPYDYIFSNMGAGIFDSNENILYERYIDKNDKQIIENELKKFTNLKITRYGILEDQEEESNNIVGYKIKGNAEFLKLLESNLKNVLSNFNIKLHAKGEKLFLNAKANTKEDAINRLIELFPEYKNYDIVTVGDDDVDFNMIRLFDGYRMKKSSKLLTDNIYKVVASVGELASINS